MSSYLQWDGLSQNSLSGRDPGWLSIETLVEDATGCGVSSPYAAGKGWGVGSGLESAQLSFAVPFFKSPPSSRLLNCVMKSCGCSCRTAPPPTTNAKTKGELHDPTCPRGSSLAGSHWSLPSSPSHPRSFPVCSPCGNRFQHKTHKQQPLEAGMCARLSDP